MKTLNFFGKKISLKIEDAKPKNPSWTKDKQKEKANEKIAKLMKNINENINARLIVLISILFVFTVFSKVNLVRNSYQEGDSAKKDVIAPISIEYEDEVKREQIIREIENTTKVYRRDYSVEEQVFKDIENYFEKISKFEPGTQDEELFIEFIKESGVILDTNYLKEILSMSSEKRDELKEKIKVKLQELFNKGFKGDPENPKELPFAIKRDMRRLEIAVMQAFIKQNDFYDVRATQESIKSRIENIGNIKVTINAGDTVLKKGDIIKKSDIIKLRNLGVYNFSSNIRVLAGVIFYSFMASIVFFVIGRKYIEKELMNNKIYYSTLIFSTLTMLAALFINIKYAYFFPMASVTLLFGVIGREKYSAVLSAMILLFLYAIFGFDQKLIICSIVGVSIGIYYIKNLKNRTDIINAGFAIGIAQFYTGIAFGFILKEELIFTIIDVMQLMISGIVSGMITIAVLPYFENSFNILTEIKLIELGDFSHPLLRELLLKAPGTFHHSIIVATLAESAAEAIGANATFARVASYYHDIGKTKRPKFFVENQVNGENPHLKMNPYLSTIIITSHTKDGEEMSRKYKLPKEIRDVMREHQGTTLLAYFYNAVRKENPDVNEEDFRYEGPKPRTKESAIIMLADSIEAAVRSLEDKNSVEIENMIRKIIHMKMDDNQLSEAELTFKNIETIINTFLKVFQGIYHSRIKYPDVKK